MMPCLSSNELSTSAGHVRNQPQHLYDFQMTIIYHLSQRFIQTGTTIDRSQPCKQTATTAVQDRYIRLTYQRNRFQATSQTTAMVCGLNGPISSEIVRRCLRAAGICFILAYNGPVLKRQHLQHRIRWAQ